MTQEKHQRWKLVIASITAIGTVLPVIFGVWKYSQSVEQAYKTPYWISQMETCVEVSAVSSKIALSVRGGAVPEKLIDELFSIYYGKGNLYFDNKTMEEVATIGSRAVQCNAGNLEEKQCINPLFNAFSMNVAEACRDMLMDTWEVPLEELNSDALKRKWSSNR